MILAFVSPNILQQCSDQMFQLFEFCTQPEGLLSVANDTQLNNGTAVAKQKKNCLWLLT